MAWLYDVGSNRKNQKAGYSFGLWLPILLGDNEGKKWNVLDKNLLM